MCVARGWERRESKFSRLTSTITTSSSSSTGLSDFPGFTVCFVGEALGLGVTFGATGLALRRLDNI